MSFLAFFASCLTFVTSTMPPKFNPGLVAEASVFTLGLGLESIALFRMLTTLASPLGAGESGAVALSKAAPISRCAAG